ncbi:zinc metalloprotease [Spirillospora albida]|uniref:zinc metalloprotease n=1 Tax=Spirillospora albida TaxID=58123 RepID=UPI000A02509C|nr:zinc metalloprotease [Spirillospora albida]
MKLLAATLLAALVPAAAPAVQEAPAARPSATARQASELCDPSTARVRTGSAHRDHNEVTAAEAAAVDRELARLRPGTVTRARITVPVYFHVLHYGAQGKLSKKAINGQMRVLNASYAGTYGGADTGITFQLKGITRTDKKSWFRNPEGFERIFKAQLHKGGPRTLNLYSAKIPGELLGWATFPWRYKAKPKQDGVIIHYGSIPGGSIAHFNLGYSATHEVGHWLGLYHTFQDGCGGKGDRVADTPPERDPTNGCPTGKDTCTAPGVDPVHNFMDYGFDECMTEFTAGQAARVRQIWSAYRA